MTRVTVVMRGSSTLGEHATLQLQTATAEAGACSLAVSTFPHSSEIGAQPRFISDRCIYLVVAAVLSLSLHALALACLSLVIVNGSVESRDSFGWLAESDPADAMVPLPTLDLEPRMVLEPVEGSELVVAAHEGLVGPEALDVLAPVLDDFDAAEESSEPAASPSEQPEPLLVSAAFVGGGMHDPQESLSDQSLAARGGSLEDDKAVEAGLRWLLAHQQADGSWRFDHRQVCGHACQNPGHHGSTTAATALGLLPLLGAGQSQSTGEHQQAVARAIAYLRSRLIETPYGGDLQEGDMYGQGLATLGLCEALAMGGDDADLRRTCELAIDYIVYAQNQRGGWRYFPKQPGDTTVLGWQVMALKAAERAGIEVPQRTWESAESFLDRVESDGGAAYGYQSAEAQPTTTAIGLLSRMQMGWRRSDDRLRRGIALLEGWGTSPDDVYYNYYATQVLSRVQPASYERWNTEMRERLIASQASDGHEAGSWYFADAHTLAGGRLCDTSLTLLTLEACNRQLVQNAELSSGSSAQ